MTKKRMQKNKPQSFVIFTTDDYQIVQEADGKLAFRFFDIKPATIKDLAEKGMEFGIIPAEEEG